MVKYEVCQRSAPAKCGRYRWQPEDDIIDSLLALEDGQALRVTLEPEDEWTWTWHRFLNRLAGRMTIRTRMGIGEKKYRLRQYHVNAKTRELWLESLIDKTEAVR